MPKIKFTSAPQPYPPCPPSPSSRPHSPSGGGTKFVVNTSASGTRPNASLHRFYPRGRNLSQPTITLVHFLLLSDFVEAAQVQDPQINRPEDIDLDSACFMMLTQDLPTMFGIMIQPANRKVKVKNLPKLDGL
jgi:hypothetical protein